MNDAPEGAHANSFAKTGHLCLSTTHANSASQTIERIFSLKSERGEPEQPTRQQIEEQRKQELLQQARTRKRLENGCAGAALA